MVLFRSQLRREMGSLVGWGVSLAAFAVLAAALWNVLAAVGTSQLNSLLSQLPADLTRLVGGMTAIFTPRGWIAALLLSSVTQMAVAVWAALSAVEVVAADRDTGTLEFLLALPVRRGQLLGQRFLALLTGLALLHVLLWLGTLLGVALSGQRVDGAALAGAFAILFLAEAALAGMLAIVSLAFRDQVRAQLASAATALVFVFLPVLADPRSWLVHLSPFDYAGQEQFLLGGAFPWGHAGLLAIWALLAFAAALAWFRRQEV